MRKNIFYQTSVYPCVCVCVCMCMRASDVEGGLPSSIYTICAILYVDDVGVYGRRRSDKTACPLSGRSRRCNKTCENSRSARLQKTRSFIYFIFSLHIIRLYAHKWNANDFLRLATKNPQLKIHIFHTVLWDCPLFSSRSHKPLKDVDFNGVLTLGAQPRNFRKWNRVIHEDFTASFNPRTIMS